MEKGLISVIIPVYNCEPYLRTYVKSVTDSDYENLQIILVDDGCTDGSSSLCDELARTDKRIEVIHKENGGPGPSSARNAGLDAAKGKYVTFLDSDDMITHDMISYMYNIAAKENCDVVQMGLCVVQDGDDYKLDVLSEEYIVITPKQAIHNIYTGCYVNVTAKLYEKRLFDDLRFPDVLHEDVYMSPRLFHKSRSIAVSEKQGYIYSASG